MSLVMLISLVVALHVPMSVQLVDDQTRGIVRFKYAAAKLESIA